MFPEVPRDSQNEHSAETNRRIQDSLCEYTKGKPLRSSKSRRRRESSEGVALLPEVQSLQSLRRLKDAICDQQLDVLSINTGIHFNIFNRGPRSRRARRYGGQSPFTNVSTPEGSNIAASHDLPDQAKSWNPQSTSHAISSKPLRDRPILRSQMSTRNRQRPCDTPKEY